MFTIDIIIAHAVDADLAGNRYGGGRGCGGSTCEEE